MRSSPSTSVAMPEALEAEPDRAQVLDAGTFDAESRPGHRRETDERADLDVVGPDRVRRAVQRGAALHA